MSTGLCIAIAFLSLIIGVIIPFGWEWLYYPWQRPYSWKPMYTPSSSGSNHLNMLIRILGEVHSWLGPRNNPLTQGLQKGLWEQINYLKIEVDSCTAIFSSKNHERVWALRRLSEIKTKRVLGVIYAISEHNSASAEIRGLAKTILQENNYEPPSKPKLKAITPPDQKRASDSPVIYSENTVINAATIGHHSPADHVHITQSSTQNYNELDLNALGRELEVLRLELKRLSQTSEEDIAVGAIAAAEIEIKHGNRSKAKEYLKQAGIWALDTATKIGVGLAVVALKTALGL